MTAIVAVRRLMHLAEPLERHAHDLAVTHAALGDDMLAEMLHVISLSLQHRDLEAGVMVEMHVQRGERKLVMLVIGVG